MNIRCIRLTIIMVTMTSVVTSYDDNCKLPGMSCWGRGCTCTRAYQQGRLS